MRCRCGGAAARKCGACGNELNSQGECPKRHHVSSVGVACAWCEKPLCLWHYALVMSPERGVLQQKCFPSCAHSLRVDHEWRPEAR